MHTFSETGAGVPAFLAKLWRLVEDPETNNLICWSKDGRSFIIQNQAQFARELLPLNYKHNNMASFIRQLNMYGFHKITSIDNGGLKFDRDEMEFSHPCFKRNCPYLLEHIKRKIANTKTIDEKASVKPEAVSKVLSDVKAMRGRQDSLDSRFSVMKQENEALWREIASLRQKHAKQQQIVNKLIQFLITIVQPSRNMTSVKRHMQLMINDTPEQAKLRKASESESEGGPVIHELGEDLFDDVNDHESELDDPSSPYANMPSVGSSRPDNDTPPLKVERPQSNASVSSHLFDYSNQSADDALNSMGNSVPGSSAVINTVNCDGNPIVYHVTEVPDNEPQTQDTLNTEENHLTTPMVREMKQSPTLKAKSQQNKRKIVSSTVTTSSSPAAKMIRTGNETNQLRIKTENNEIDPFMLLNTTYPSPGTTSSTGANLSENNGENCSSISNSLNMSSGIDPRLLSPRSDLSEPVITSNNDADMYNAGGFIASDMPTELFDESPIIDDTNLLSGGCYSNKYDSRSKPSSSGRQQMQLQSLGKTTNYNNGGTPSSTKNSNLQLAKMSKSNGIGDDPRLSSVDEVSLHLDGVQDDLDTLKDLLRGDGYSLDANTLLGNGTSAASRIYLPTQLEADIFNKLFNDTDILGSYGLSMTADNSQDKKGSELMAYQPIYDLSDIMDINNKDNETVSNETNCKEVTEPSSVLNTPYHE